MYLRKKIKFLRVKKETRAACRTEVDLLRSRIEFACKLKEIIAQKGPIIYFYETTFNTWQASVKSWCRVDDRIHLILNPKRVGGSQFTVQLATA